MAVLRGAHAILSNFGPVVLGSSSGEVISSDTYTVVFANTSLNLYSSFNTTTGIFAAPYSGYFQVKSTVWVDITGADTGYIRIEKNNSALTRSESKTATDSSVFLSASVDVYLSAGDEVYVELDGLNGQVIPAGVPTYLSVVSYPNQ